MTCLTHNQTFDDVKYGIYTSPLNRNEKFGKISCCFLDEKHLEAEKRTGFKKLLNSAETRNHEIINLSDLFEKNSLLTVNFTVKCRKHNQVFDKMEYREYLFGPGVPCCAKKTKIEKMEEQKKEALKKVAILAERRGHRIVHFEYPGPTVKECHFTVKCLKHNETDNMVRYKIYSQTNNKSGGLACCKRRSVKTFQTPMGKTQMWIRDLCLQAHVEIPTCQFTGLVSSSEQQIVVVGHHLYSHTQYSILSQLPQNGILLVDLIHREFHKQFPNSQMITPKTFLLFLQQFLEDGRQEPFEAADYIDRRKLF